jgi:hypothetical protein
MSPYNGRVGRVLFVLHEPGYFRLYGTTIVEMERRGWDVAIAFDAPDKRGSVRLVPVGAGPDVQSVGALPGHVSPAAATLRTALDYLRYLEPSFAGAAYLRRRIERLLPRGLRFLTHVKTVPRWVVSATLRVSRGAERLMAVDRVMVDWLRAIDPDVIVVSPVVIVGRSGARQTEITKAGRVLGIPVVVGVASWDHLTSKGLIRVVPDAVAVWNDTQAREAEFLHRIPRSRIMVTGAQSLDHWFAPASPDAAREFRRSLGIAENRPLLLFAGSSRKMAPNDSEEQFVRRWLAALRESTNAAVREAFVLVRPHPSNQSQWESVDLDDTRAVVHPRRYSGLPMTDEEVETFRQSLLASTAVVGVNTTAMIEAAILKRPVFTVRDPAFAHSQRQTLHFGYLADAQQGCAIVADSLQQHVAQLEATMTAGAPVEPLDRFVQRFVRPRGIGTPATDHLCDGIENVARVRERSGGKSRIESRDYSVAFSDPRRH